MELLTGQASTLSSPNIHPDMADNSDAKPDEVFYEMEDFEYFPFGYRVAATIVHVVIFVLGLVGNIVLLIVVRKNRSLQSPTFAYLVSLAYADLIVLLSAVPESLVQHHIGRQWLLGQAGCSLLVFFNFLGINAGSLSILAFTLEQYIAICGDCSRRFHMSDRTNKYVLGIWICSVLYCAPWLGLTHVQPDADDHTRQQCELRLTRETYIGFFGADLLLFYVLPLIIALFVYTKIVFLLFKSARYCSRGSPCLSLSRSNLNEASNSNSQQVTPVLHYTKGLACTTSATMLFGRVLNHQVSENIEERRGWLVQSRSQVTRMLIAIVIFFAIAWLPYRGLLVYNTFQKEEWLDIWYVFFAKTLIYANSAMNPYLYNAMSRRFRLAVYRTLCRASAKKKKQLSKKRTLYQRPPRYEEPQFEPVPQQRGRLRTL